VPPRLGWVVQCNHNCFRYLALSVLSKPAVYVTFSSFAFNTITTKACDVNRRIKIPIFGNNLKTSIKSQLSLHISLSGSFTK
jgi:hypothetical protein